MTKSDAVPPALILADINLARDIDCAEARLSASVAEMALRDYPMSCPFIEPIAGGVAVYAGPDSPSNKLIGLGFNEDLDPAVLGRIEKAYFDRDSVVQAEVSILARPAVHALLTNRGYALQGFENVLARALTEDDIRTDMPRDITIRRIEKDEVNRLVNVMVTGFEHPDESGAGSGVAPPPGAAIEHAMGMFAKTRGFRGYMAYLGGEVAGGGCLRVDGNIAQLCGAATLPGCRCRGVQTALLTGRLSDARQSGCTLAVLTAQPGSKSHFNAQRRGFGFVYTRAILVKEIPEPNGD